jgi:hypothetical protein
MSPSYLKRYKGSNFCKIELKFSFKVADKIIGKIEIWIFRPIYDFIEDKRLKK